MRVNIAGRQVEVTKALQQFTEKKLSKLEKLLDGPVEAHVVLGIEKHRHLCEMQVRSRTALLSGQSETEDLYASVGDVVDKLERQALKHKEKRARTPQMCVPRRFYSFLAMGATARLLQRRSSACSAIRPAPLEALRASTRSDRDLPHRRQARLSRGQPRASQPT